MTCLPSSDGFAHSSLNGLASMDLADAYLPDELMARRVLTQRRVESRTLMPARRDANQRHHQHDERCWFWHRTCCDLRYQFIATVCQGGDKVAGVRSAIPVKVAR